MEHQSPAARPTTGQDTHTDTIRVTVPFISGESMGHPHVAQIHGDLLFDPADPYAVQLVIGRGDGPTVTWSFARDLLAEGLYDPAGDGDVLVWPCLGTAGEAVVVIELRSPSGMAMLQTPSRAIQRFVDTMFDAVPAGAETSLIDLDELVAHLLG